MKDQIIYPEQKFLPLNLLCLKLINLPYITSIFSKNEIFKHSA